MAARPDRKPRHAPPRAPRAVATPALPAGNDPAWLALDRQLCFALYSTSLAMTRLYKPHLDRLGLTYPQYLVMLALWQHDGDAVGELGARVFLDSGTLTPLLKRLADAGLVERRRSATDERRVEIHLSTAGRRLRQRALGVPASIAAATGCSLSDIDELTRRLHGLRDRLGASLAA
jgi:MarR family transcriptional regulator, organic hydroperoxide resistance regulator